MKAELWVDRGYTNFTPKRVAVRELSAVPRKGDQLRIDFHLLTVKRVQFDWDLDLVMIFAEDSTFFDRRDAI